MKRKFKIKTLLVVGASLLLASCETDTSTSSSEMKKELVDLAMNHLEVRVNDDYSYHFSIQVNRELNDEELYLSSNDIFDEDDILVTYKNIENNNTYCITFDETLEMNDFYLLFISKEGSLLLKENVVLPTFRLTISSGEESNTGNDILSFSYLENGYVPSNFFDEGGINVYRSKDSSFSEGETDTVIKGQSISDEFILPNEKNDLYYKLSASFGSGKGIYYSEVFKKDEQFGDDVVDISSVKIERGNSLTLKIDGNIKKQISSLGLLLVNTKGTTPLYKKAMINENFFSLETPLNLTEGIYNIYLSLNSGIYFPIKFSSLERKDNKKIFFNSAFYSFYSNNDFLSINVKEHEAVNVLSSSLLLENGKPTMKVEGYFDSAKFGIDPSTGEQMTVYNPILAFLSDDYEERVYFPLTLEGNFFSVTADLSSLTKYGIWYSIKLFFNTSTNENGVFNNAATYELQISDTSSFGEEIRLEDPLNLYRFQNYNNNLKLEIKDYSSSIESWEYILVNNRMQLRLSGSFYRGDSSIDVYYGNGEDHHISKVVTNEKHEFQVDVDVEDIEAYTNYHVHWIGDSFGDNEITNEFLNKPHAILANNSGYIYSVKQETINSTKYFKVYKDIDSAKATDIVFSSNSDKAYANVCGYLNSSLEQKDLYLQFAKGEFLDNKNMTYTDISYYSLETEKDLSFSCQIDISNMEKSSTYQLKLIYKKDGKVSEVTTEKTTYCAFYTEYLPLTYATKSLTTKNGTYRIRNYGGLHDHWEIYIILA